MNMEVVHCDSHAPAVGAAGTRELPLIPREILKAISAYGVACSQNRASPLGALADCLEALREWAGSLQSLPNPAQLRAMARPSCVPGRRCERYARGLGGCVAGHCNPPTTTAGMERRKP